VEREPKHFAGWVLPPKNLARFRHRDRADRIVPEVFVTLLPGNVIKLADRHWLLFERALHGCNNSRTPNAKKRPQSSAVFTWLNAGGLHRA
jgi:hypothetical protein